MKNIKKILSLALISAVASSIVACDSKGNDANNNDGSNGVAQKVVATDAIDREVEKPDSMERLSITCRGGATQEIAILGASDNIVAQPEVGNFAHLLKMYPSFKDVIDPGSFDDVNVEELLSVNPDIAFVGITSKDGNKLIEDAGIPTFTMLIGTASIDSLMKEFGMVGKMLGNEERSTDLVNYWETKLAMVKEMVSKVPEKDRKKVYYSGENITSASTGIWSDSLIVESGGINVTSSMTKGAKGSEVSIEEVIGWDPDVVITQKRKSGLSALKDDARIQDLKAIKNDTIYQCPTGAFWWDRPSPESPLGFMWLANTLYPEYTKEMDLKKETKEFYKQFYNYELTDEEYKSFF